MNASSLCHADSIPEVHCLGPEATFSHAAALERFGPSARIRMADSIPAVFEKTLAAPQSYGIVPVENSIEGSVGLTLDCLATFRGNVHGEIFLKIEHNLLGTATNLAHIRRVYSHPQALGQCRIWLGRHLPGVECIPCSSTAAAARETHGKPDSAAIGSSLLARRHGLRILADHIQDRSVNLTRFLILSRNPAPPPSGADRTSMVVSLAHRPGSLCECLGCFAEAEINLTHIESRPCPDTPFRYTFFLDAEGHAGSEPLKSVLVELEARSHEIRVLGSYPRGNYPGSF